MKWVYVVFFVLLFQISIPINVNSQINVDQEVVYEGNSNEYIPFRYNRLDGEIWNMVDSQVFPMASLGTGGSFLNLGVAWITRTLEYEGYLIAEYSVFDRGKVTEYPRIGGVNGLFREVYWNWAQDNLFFIGVTDTQTVLIYFPYQRQAVPITLDFTSSGHEVYFTSDIIRIFMFVEGEPRNYVLTNVGGLEPTIAEDIQIDSFPGFGGLFELENGSLEIQSPLFNRIVPPQFTNNSLLGHSLLSPTIFDVSIGKGWVADIDLLFDLPVNSVDSYRLGFASSLIRTANNTIYELDDTNNWIEIAKFDEKYEPFNFAIIDVDLYVGTIFDNGLQFLLGGVDGDNDHVPDIFEGYYFSSPNSIDTDKDTIPDNVEISFGTDPSRDDRNEDKDGDRAVNIEEYNSVLGDIQLDPSYWDSDFGGALDGWELKYQYNPYNKSDDLLDEDGDGVNNEIESLWNSDPFSKDTDGDGMPDGWEIQYQLSPTNPRNANFDYDSDGRTNLQEYREGTDPWVPDPPPLYDQVLLVFIAFCIFTLPIVNQIWSNKLGDQE